VSDVTSDTTYREFYKRWINSGDLVNLRNYDCQIRRLLRPSLHQDIWFSNIVDFLGYAGMAS